MYIVAEVPTDSTTETPSFEKKTETVLLEGDNLTSLLNFRT